MTRIISEVNGDDGVKVLVLKGEGRAFGAGHDVGEPGVIHDNVPGMRRPSQRKRLHVGGLWGRPGVYQAICWCQKATVCQVQGICYGAQFEFANNADIVIASEDATFTHPGFRYIGPVDEIGVLIETIGLKRVKEMMLTGIPMTAPEALKAGLVNKVVPLDKPEEETEKMVDAICRLPFDGIVMGKAKFEAAMDALGIGSAWNAVDHPRDADGHPLRGRRVQPLQGAQVGRRDGRDSRPRRALLREESEALIFANWRQVGVDSCISGPPALPPRH